MHTTIAGEAHQMHALAVGLGILVGRHYLGVFQDAAVCTGAVNLHQILIYDATGTDIEVSYLRVTHLSVGQTYTLSACQELAVRVCSIKVVHERCGCIEDHITLAMIADAPSVEDHQKCFLCHNILRYVSYLFLFRCKIT